MPYEDLQQFVAEADAKGEVRHLPGVSPDLEIGALTEYASRSPMTPALLFEDIPGVRVGRILTNGLKSPSRLGRVLQIGENLTAADAVDRWRQRLKTRAPIPVRQVDDGPVLTRVSEGANVDLTAYPAPMWHAQDGGRYIGTADVIINQDPESGYVNVGTYRVMLQGPNTVSIHISPGHHGRLIGDRYLQQGKPCPIAIVLGVDPAVFIASRAIVPWGTSEYEVAGWIRGEPVSVVRGPTTGLPIPAGAELVLEGRVLTDRKCQEGPFGEFTGYYAGVSQTVPVVEITAVLERPDPIVWGSPPQKPPAESTFVTSVLRSAQIWNDLDRNGIQSIRGVWQFPAAAQFITVVSMSPRYGGQAKQAGYLASMGLGGAFLGRFVVVVDDDIDPTDTDEVLWAMGTRTDLAKGLEKIDGCWSTPLDPSMPPEKKASRDFTNTRVVIDATRPYSWRKDFPKVSASPPEALAAVVEKWKGKLGF